jgi:hypothetical protein
MVYPGGIIEQLNGVGSLIGNEHDSECERGEEGQSNAKEEMKIHVVDSLGIPCSRCVM